jgi:hypothetical protein
MKVTTKPIKSYLIDITVTTYQSKIGLNSLHVLQLVSSRKLILSPCNSRVNIRSFTDFVIMPSFPQHTVKCSVVLDQF